MILPSSEYGSDYNITTLLHTQIHIHTTHLDTHICKRNKQRNKQTFATNKQNKYKQTNIERCPIHIL